jgi:hypothetical protein
VNVFSALGSAGNAVKHSVETLKVAALFRQDKERQQSAVYFTQNPSPIYSIILQLGEEKQSKAAQVGDKPAHGLGARRPCHAHQTEAALSPEALCPVLLTLNNNHHVYEGACLNY